MRHSRTSSVRIVLLTVVVVLSITVPTVAVGEPTDRTAPASTDASAADEAGSATAGATTLCGAGSAVEAARTSATALAQNVSGNTSPGASSITVVELPGSVLVVYTRRPPQNRTGRIYRRVIAISKESFSCPDRGKVGLCREVFRRRETVRTGRSLVVTNYYSVQCECRFRPRSRFGNGSANASRPLVGQGDGRTRRQA